MKRYKLAGMMILAIMLSRIGGSGGILYWGGGTTNIPDNTPISTNPASLSGVWDTTTKNWSTDSNGTTYVAWSNSGTDNWAYLPSFGTTNSTVFAAITQVVDMVANRITADLTKIGGNYNQYYLITATNARTLTLTGATPILETLSGDATRYLRLSSNVKLAGTNGFSKNGTGPINGYVEIDGDGSAVTGKVTLISGSPPTSWFGLFLQSPANLRGVQQFDVKSGSLAIQAGAGNNNQLADSAVVRLFGTVPNNSPLGGASAFTYRSANAVSTEIVSQVSVDSSGWLVLLQASSPKGTLILAHPTAGGSIGALMGKGPC